MRSTMVRWLAGTLSGLAWAGTAPAVPLLSAEVSAGHAGPFVHAQHSDGGVSVQGTAFYSDFQHGASAGPGHLVNCSQVLCDAIGGNAGAAAEADGNLGRLRAAARATTGERLAGAYAVASIFDVVTFDNPEPRLRLQVHGSSDTNSRGRSFLDLTIRLCPHDNAGTEDNCFSPVFTFHAQDFGGSLSDAWSYGYGDGSQNPLGGDDTNMPSQPVEIDVPLLTIFDEAPEVDTEYDLFVTLRTDAQCDDRGENSVSSCHADFDALSTVYVGLTGLGSSTYRYPGPSATDPGNNVPTPASLPLVLAGIGAAAVGTVRPRRRQGR